MSVKYSTAWYLSKCSCQCTSQLLRMNFERSCDQVPSQIPLSKKNITIIMTKVILIKCPFLPLVANENNNNEQAECHGIFMPFKGDICSKKIIISSSLNEAKVSTVNSDLQTSSTFIECMKTLNELCVFTGFSYTLFTKRLLLIRISLLKHVIYRRVNAS